MEDSDLHIPIAHRKGVRDCKKHPINRFVNYEILSPNFKAFTANFDTVEVPKNVHEAMQHPEWGKECEL